MKRSLSFVLLSLGTATVLHAQLPFDTTVVNYVYVGAAGTNSSTSPTEIYTAPDAASGAFTKTATVTGTANKLNGFGLNQKDGFLYGIAFPNAAAASSAALYRVGADGVAAQVATLQPPTFPGLTVINTTAGMVDASGDYRLTAYTYSGNPFVTPYSLSGFKFYVGDVADVKSLRADTVRSIIPDYKEVDFNSDPTITAAFQSFLTNFNYANPGASNGGMEDIAISPVTGKLYSYLSYPDPSNSSQLLHRPVVLDPNATGGYTLHTVGTVINNTPNREIAGAYFDSAGNYFVIFTDGTYSQVNLITGALFNTVTATVSLSNANLRGDLASNFPSPIVLPVTIKSFDATVTAGNARLQWATSLEAGISNYIVEKSTDGKSFTTIGSIAPQGSNSSYAYNNALTGTAWYRLRMELKDDALEYTKSIRLSNNDEPNHAVTIYPTAVWGNSFKVVCAVPARITVYGMDGRVAYQYAGIADAGVTDVPFNAAPGMYVVRVADAATGQVYATQRISRQ